MATPALTGQQEDDAATFCSVTGAELTAAIAFLKKHDWQLERAVASFLAARSPAHAPAAAPNEDGSPPVRAALPQRTECLFGSPALREPLHLRRRTPVSARPSGVMWNNPLLAELYAPPHSLRWLGSFDAVCTHAAMNNRWLLVNLQEHKQFKSHLLNRDTWSSGAVVSLVRRAFVFWQNEVTSANGERFRQLYRPASLPCIAVLDPRTRQQLAIWTGYVPPTSLLRRLNQFLDAHGSLQNTGVKRKREEEAGKMNKRSRTGRGTPRDPIVVAGSEDEWNSVSEEDENEEEEQEKEEEEEVHSVLRSAHPEPAEKARKPERAEVPETVPDGLTTTQVRIRLKDGTILQRQFAAEWPLTHLYTFVAGHLGSARPFVLCTSFPRRELPDSATTLTEARVLNSALMLEWSAAE